MLFIQILFLTLLIIFSATAFVYTFYLFWTLEKQYSKKKLIKIKPDQLNDLNGSLEHAFDATSTDDNSSKTQSKDDKASKKEKELSHSKSDLEVHNISSIKQLETQSDSDKRSKDVKSNLKLSNIPSEKIKESIQSVKKDYTQLAKLPPSIVNLAKSPPSSGQTDSKSSSSGSSKNQSN